MSLKPCIECGKECEILPVQLGDLFTISFLRVCSAECMFRIAYAYLRECYEHKNFRNKLYEMQNEEDKKLAEEYIKKITDEALKCMEEHLMANPNLLSTPLPQSIVNAFSSGDHIPMNSSETCTFTRPKLEDRIKWAKEYVERCKDSLREAFADLEKLENET